MAVLDHGSRLNSLSFCCIKNKVCNFIWMRYIRYMACREWNSCSIHLLCEHTLDIRRNWFVILRYLIPCWMLAPCRRARFFSKYWCINWLLYSEQGGSQYWVKVLSKQLMEDIWITPVDEPSLVLSQSSWRKLWRVNKFTYSLILFRSKGSNVNKVFDIFLSYCWVDIVL